MSRKGPWLGGTGRFPHKMLNADDEGELRFAVAHDERGLVHVNFGKPVAWFAMPKAQALEFAKLLAKHAGAKKIEVEL